MLGETGCPKHVFRLCTEGHFPQQLCPAVPVLHAQYRNLCVERLFHGILSLKAKPGSSSLPWLTHTADVHSCYSYTLWHCLQRQ